MRRSVLGQVLRAVDPGQVAQLGEQRRVVVVVGQVDHAVDQPVVERVHRRGVGLGAARGIAQQQPVARRLGHRLHALDDLPVEGIGDVRHQHHQQVALGHGQAAAGGVAAVAGGRDRALDPLAGLGADRLAVVHHPGDGGDGHAGQAGDLVDGGQFFHRATGFVEGKVFSRFLDCAPKDDLLANPFFAHSGKAPMRKAETPLWES